MNQRNFRKWHRVLAPIVFLPLFLTAFTGVFYRVGRTWFGLSSDWGELLMVIHQGTWLGKDLRVFYVLLNGLGVFAMLLTGIIMTRIFQPSRRNKPDQT